MHSLTFLKLNSLCCVGVGLGLAYAGTRRQDVVSLLLPVLSDKKSSPEVVALAALACGLITVGAADSEVLSNVLQTLLDLPVSELQEGQYSRFLPLAIGLCYLGNFFQCLRCRNVSQYFKSCLVVSF